MGNAATRDLASSSDFQQITIGDVDQAKAQALADELGGAPRVDARAVNVTDVEGLTTLFADYDIVLNCTSYAFGLGITHAAIAAKKPLLDLGGLYNTPKQLAHCRRFTYDGVAIALQL